MNPPIVTVCHRRHLSSFQSGNVHGDNREHDCPNAHTDSHPCDGMNGRWIRGGSKNCRPQQAKDGPNADKGEHYNPNRWPNLPGNARTPEAESRKYESGKSLLPYSSPPLWSWMTRRFRLVYYSALISYYDIIQ